MTAFEDDFSIIDFEIRNMEISGSECSNDKVSIGRVQTKIFRFVLILFKFMVLRNKIMEKNKYFEILTYEKYSFSDIKYL